MKGEFFVQENEKNERLDKFFLQKEGSLTRAHIKNLIEQGQILVDGKTVKAGQLLKVGQRVSFDFLPPKEVDAKAEDVDFEIVYEDKDLLVVNKPQGLVVHPCASTRTGTLVNGLLSRVKDLSGINGVLRPGIVHRLDKNTSGLMVVAKNDMAHISLSKQIKDKTCKRKYLALVEGHLKEDSGTIKTFIDRNPKDRKKMAVTASGREAITNYKVVKRYIGYDLVEFSLQTGRTHQIRVHAKSLGHPVVGDDVYGKAVKGLNGQLLHSYYIEFVHPRTQEKMSFSIGLPQHFEDYLKKLKEE